MPKTRQCVLIIALALCLATPFTLQASTTSFPGGNDGRTPCDSFTSTPVACQTGDKLFTTWSTTSPFPAGTTLTVAQSDPLTYLVTVNNPLGLKTPFDFNYTVSVDTTSCPTCKIFEVDAGVTGGKGTLANMFTTVVPPGSSSTVTRTTGEHFFIEPGVLSVTVTNHYDNVNASNYVTTLSNTIIQGQATPEPISLGLTGVGLSVMAVIARRKLRKGA